MAEHICEMRLCEASRLVLKPNMLYMFTIDPNCKTCRSEAFPYSVYCHHDRTERADNGDNICMSCGITVVRK